MAHEILSVKMYELDKKLEQTHSRIQLAETMEEKQLARQIRQVQQECAENRIVLKNQLHHSKTECVMKLAKFYDEMEAAIGNVLEKQNIDLEKERSLSGTEEKILTAEYALDFAMQAANIALLVSLEAIDSQRIEETKERNPL